MINNYNPEKPSTFFTFLDANNLYGWTIYKPLPYARFKWINDMSSFDMMPEDSDTSYILKVDLEYPVEKHDNHNDLSFNIEV